MRSVKAVSPLIATVVLIAIVLVAGLAVYSLTMGWIGILSPGVEVQITSVDLIRTENKVLLSVLVKNTGVKALAGIVVSGVDGGGKRFSLALPPVDPGETSSNTLLIPLDASNIALDGSGNNNHGTIHGASWVDGKFGKALSFDGVDDRVEIPGISEAELDIHKPFSVELWVKGESLRNRDSGMLQIETAKGLIRFSLAGVSRMNSEANTPNKYDRFLWGGPVWEEKKWYHVVAVVNPITTKTYLYRDGQLVFTSHTTPEKWNSLGDVMRVAIGIGYYCSNWNGVIDGVRNYNRALTPEENAWNNAHPGCPVTDGLILWLPLDEGSNNPYSFTRGERYPLTITAYSPDGSVFTTTATVTCQ